MGNIHKEKAKIQRRWRNVALDVVGFGENSVDWVAVVGEWPQPDSKQRLVRFEQMPGGQVATAMVVCASLGCRARYVGAFGGDSHGEWLQRQLTGRGVDVVGVVRAAASSRMAFVLVDQQTGARTILEHRDPALDVATVELPLSSLTAGRVLLVDATDLPAAVHAATSARQAGIPTVADVDRPAEGLRALIAETDILVTSADFPTRYTGCPDLEKALRQLATEGPELVVATQGSAGSVAVHGDELIRTPAPVVEAVDTTGAGDAFRAGLIAAWVKGRLDAEVEVLLRQANTVAALSCRGRGAQGAVPSWDEVSTWPGGPAPPKR